MKSISIESKTAAVTRKIGQAIGQGLRPGDVILLAGPLGAGKTTLVQGIAKGLGVMGSVMSPTFVLMRELDGRLKLYHLDLYRLEKMPEIADLGLDDYLFGEGVTVVEWADRATALWPEAHLRIDLEYGEGARGRRLRAEAHGERYRKLLDNLAAKFGDWR
ncbi:tRNA (adenosine(37)-N6)-threonylcarbamoyltransferase complex ATPase subunit type 1 TsaE [Dehalogenimonas alkenigignens]|uniref:tRNA threonylcarbamoyladenosine biosynthesis protein TsaE n=1 Tax=Dehalogenimonas alkenigignens TaxID=1217799 RepID=A0A0W0GHL9_9CHLR|nr:tRNA (adenosine(37)-N6)-threonylcarbamoyltransferase complex ATPase subunit type 1 TsaE [Dehalogenimonas alkenigignens]KTB48059.1 tRNA threonylcarbamoyl adenosine modification protein YjeE [Dehalogenimonas alkenigignens]PVV84312.1 tRNA (adenosine(37)-N6)-threonylcarbamoyltransferase complex ATPase subunit type 1 TsaE [Dehalogenimonas alkenigignens]